ncbi:MAG TPA: hypothetical protein VH763_03765 [Gemmatimonadales bacterium]|jgi:hypothetical protein
MHVMQDESLEVVRFPEILYDAPRARVLPHGDTLRASVKLTFDVIARK